VSAVCGYEDDLRLMGLAYTHAVSGVCTHVFVWDRQVVSCMCKLPQMPVLCVLPGSSCCCSCGSLNLDQLANGAHGGSRKAAGCHVTRAEVDPAKNRCCLRVCAAAAAAAAVPMAASTVPTVSEHKLQAFMSHWLDLDPAKTCIMLLLAPLCCCRRCCIADGGICNTG
jgi:hypothetical protein